MPAWPFLFHGRPWSKEPCETTARGPCRRAVTHWLRRRPWTLCSSPAAASLAPRPLPPSPRPPPSSSGGERPPQPRSAAVLHPRCPASELQSPLHAERGDAPARTEPRRPRPRPGARRVNGIIAAIRGESCGGAASPARSSARPAPLRCPGWRGAARRGGGSDHAGPSRG